LNGRVRKRVGFSEEAIPYIDEAFQRFTQLARKGNQNAERMASASLTEKGDCLLGLGRLEEAAEAYEQGIGMSEKLKDVRSVAVGNIQLGTVRKDQGQLKEALDAYRESIMIFTTLGEHRNVAGILHQMGIVYERAELWVEAEDAYRKSLQIKVQQHNPAGEAASLVQLGNLYSKKGLLEDSVVFHRQAAKKFMEIDDISKEGLARSNLTSTLIQLKRYKEARPEVLRAIECMIPLGHSGLPWLAYNNLYILEKAEGNLEAAAKAREQAFQLFLSYRRAGGENHESGGKLCAWFLQAFSNPGEEPEPIENQLLDLAHTPHQPQVFYQLITKLLAILSGSRDRSLYQDPELDYQAAVELKLILEKVGGEEGLLRNAE